METIQKSQPTEYNCTRAVNGYKPLKEVKEKMKYIMGTTTVIYPLLNPQKKIIDVKCSSKHMRS